MSKGWIWTTVAVLAMTASSFAAKHPVPLESNTDAKKCLECHEDKTKGKSVHSAMAMGCLSCHEIRVIKSRDKKREDVTRVKLIKATASGQCLTCHHGMKNSTGNSRTHLPVTRNCLICHDPHVSENQNLLKKTASGDLKENLCLACHTTGVKAPEKGSSRHAALDMGCGTCHVTHKTGPADKRDNRFHLTKDAPALCLECHDATDKKLTNAHQDQPFASADCLTCHDPHESAKPKLAQRTLHQPFESKACDSCHAAAKDGKVVLTNTDTRALCVTCHDEQAQKIEKAKVQHAGAQGECVACHSPHASAFDRLMKPDPVQACESCHAAQADMHKNKPVLHGAAFRDGCFTCHTGHGGERPKLLRAEGNRLCLECHSPNRKPKLDEETGTIRMFAGTLRMPGDYLARTPALDLRGGDATGHPTASHPVAATIDRSDAGKTKSMTCMSCHDPHAGAGPGMFVENLTGSKALCSRCHAGMIGGGTEADAVPAGMPAPAAEPQKKGKKK